MASQDFETVAWDDGVVLIDQTKLPRTEEYIRANDVSKLVGAIERLSVRGAPAIGVAGAFGVALAVRQYPPARDRAAFDEAVARIREARPTAVNLARRVDEVMAAIEAEPEFAFERALASAHAILEEERMASVEMGNRGFYTVLDLCNGGPVTAMTICNTGGLATVERGTALAVIQTLHERQQLVEALPVETRPLLQGARLTTWELDKMGAPYRLIVDSAGPALISRGYADVVLVGADRIAANGDTANKIGTYSLALASKRAGVPFVVVAPESTVDLDTPDGSSIEIEDRAGSEVTSVLDHPIAAPGAGGLNPAFDVTPVDLITALVTDRRVVRFDQGQSIDRIGRLSTAEID